MPFLNKIRKIWLIRQNK